LLALLTKGLLSQLAASALKRALPEPEPGEERVDAADMVRFEEMGVHCESEIYIYWNIKSLLRLSAF
jgi:hypothetical protein